MTMIITAKPADVDGVSIDAMRRIVDETATVQMRASFVTKLIDAAEGAQLPAAPAVEPDAWTRARYALTFSDEVLKEISKLTGEKLRAVKQRDALVVERDAIIEESNGYLYMADHAKGEWRKAEAALAKANAGFESAYRVLKKQRDDCDSNNLQLAERNVNLRYELEQSEAKRLQLLAALDGKDELINDFSKANTQIKAELASTKQQLTELKLKHEQPAAFPWNLYGPNGFFFTSYTASIASKAAAEPATAEAAAV